MAKLKICTSFITVFFLTGFLLSCTTTGKQGIKETQIIDQEAAVKKLPSLKIKNSVVEVASDKKGLQKTPVISFDSTHFDFGEIIEGNGMVHSFTIKNIGTDILKIKSVRPG